MAKQAWALLACGRRVERRRACAVSPRSRSQQAWKEPGDVSSGSSKKQAMAKTLEERDEQIAALRTEREDRQEVAVDGPSPTADVEEAEAPGSHTTQPPSPVRPAQSAAPPVEQEQPCDPLDCFRAWDVVQNNRELLESILGHAVVPRQAAATSGSRRTLSWGKHGGMISCACIGHSNSTAYRPTEPSAEEWLTDASREALRTLGRLAQVCKQWHALAERDTFWQLVAAAPGRCNSFARLTKQRHLLSWRDHYAQAAMLTCKKQRNGPTLYNQGRFVKVSHRPTRSDYVVAVVVSHRGEELLSAAEELSAFRGDVLIKQARTGSSSTSGSASKESMQHESFTPVIDLVLLRKRDGKSFVLASGIACNSGGGEIRRRCISAKDSPAYSVEFPGALEVNVTTQAKAVPLPCSSCACSTSPPVDRPCRQCQGDAHASQEMEAVGVEVRRVDTAGPPVMCWGAICAHGTVSRSIDDLLRHIDREHQYIALSAV